MTPDLCRALFDRPTLSSAYVVCDPAPMPGETVTFTYTYSPVGGRHVAPKPKVGPRGGDSDRAKTKAARKANLRRRRGQ